MPADAAPPDDPRRKPLGRLLAAHEPADAAEAGSLRRVLALLELPGDVLGRGHFDPGHVTASVFVTRPSPAGDELLLIWHTKLGRWLQPGGHVDPADADVPAAALRELREETGLHVTGGRLLDVDVHPIPASPKRGEPAHEHFDVRLHVEVPAGAVAVAGDDAGAARWVPLAEVGEAASDASVMRAARKLLAGR